VPQCRGHGCRSAAVVPLGDSAGDGTGSEWNRPSYGIVLKSAALRALARGCTPDADAAPTAVAAAVPKATAGAVSTHVLELLVPLLSVEEDMREYGVAGVADQAHLRASAARALLHLMQCHDALLSPDAYVALALTMQDPVMEVREQFGEQVGEGDGGEEGPLVREGGAANSCRSLSPCDRGGHVWHGIAWSGILLLLRAAPPTRRGNVAAPRPQVRLFLLSSLRLKRRPHLIAKYAALLPLAGGQWAGPGHRSQVR
jgi:hypothetical protein